VGDPDGGLVPHHLPGANEPAITNPDGSINVLVDGTYVDTYGGTESCAIVADGGLWWEIGTPQLATGGWVNARYLITLAEWESRQDRSEEPDAHSDCLVLADLPSRCFEVTRRSGAIVRAPALSDEDRAEFHLACAYQGNAGACEVLAYHGPGDGIGNSLTQAPTEALRADCNTLSGVQRRLACAELATR
ncbi:MAG: hypothetical protein OEY23_10155, partial [Acidimicrobiia bacterium]|nr:hypothetical protein [Acidimicrobiia bacterium]